MAFALSFPLAMLAGGIFLLASQPRVRVRRGVELADDSEAEGPRPETKQVATASPELQRKLLECLPSHVSRTELTVFTDRREDVVDVASVGGLGTAARVCFREELVGRRLPGHALGEWILVLQR